MRIGLRVLCNPSWTGGIHYVLNIARMLRNLPESERPEAVVFLTTLPESEKIAAAHSDLADAIAPFIDAPSLNLDFVYPATQLAEAPMGAPWAGWIPDWQCQHLPELFNDQERNRRFMQYRILAQRCATTVVSSQMARDDTLRIFAPDVAPLNVLRFPAIFDGEVYQRSQDQIDRTRARYGAAERYAMVGNQFWVHKNHLVVFEALQRMDSELCVVMTGELDDERWPEYSGRIRDLLADPVVSRRVILTGRIDRSDQIDLMLGAQAFIQPSRFEGWSTFVEEARALGKPLLLSEFPVHREQAPEGSVFFDPESPEDLAAKLDRWFADPPAAPAMAEVQARHAAFMLSCARDFMRIAAATRDAFEIGVHDPASIAVQALAELRSDVAEGLHGLTAEDETRFQAAVRRLFSDYPEELARLCNALDRSGALGASGVGLIIAATLRKMPPAGRRRFVESAKLLNGAAAVLADKILAEDGVA